MRCHIRSISKNSIGFKMIVGVICTLVPFIILLIYSNFCAMNVVRNQVAESNKNMISLYMKLIDKNFDYMDKYLFNLLSTNNDVSILQDCSDDNSFFFASQSLSERVLNDTVGFRSMVNFFIYDISRNRYIEPSTGGESYEERDSIKKYIMSISHDINVNNNSFIRGWRAVKLNNQYYIIRIVKVGDICLGAWKNAKDFLNPLNSTEPGIKGVPLFITDRSEPMGQVQLIQENSINLKYDIEEYYLSGKGNKYLIVGEKSVMGNFSLIVIIPEKEILDKLPKLQKIITYFSICSILLLPICLLLLRKLVLKPLKLLLTAMRRIKEGDMDLRIFPHNTSDEFLIVNDTFNNMITQIQKLKISVYEEQLDKQKAELEHLQLQINPHFFLNSLNIIYNFAQMRNYKLVQDMTIHLVKYLRYLFRSNLTFMPIKDELEHVNNYLVIQKLRFPNNFTHEISVDESVINTVIPTLMIQIFVENTIKHAVTMSSKIHLIISICYIDDARNPYIKITISDTGKGFSEDVLEELNAGNRILMDAQVEHIGIQNVQQRLKILYSGKANIIFANMDSGGAIVQIMLPIQLED